MILKSYLRRENVKVLPYARRLKRHFITFPENLWTTSGLPILMHGVISLPDGRYFTARRDVIIW